MFAAYPHLSGYATFNNNPISFADPTGWEPCNDCDTPLVPYYDESGASSDNELTVSNNNNEKPISNKGSNLVEKVTDIVVDILKIVDNETGGLVSDVKISLQIVKKGIQAQASVNPYTGEVHKGLYSESQTPILDLDGNEVPFEDAMFAPARLGIRYILRKGKQKKVKNPPGTNSAIKVVEDVDIIVERQTTVLGTWNAVDGGYVALAKQLGANYFNIPTDIWNTMTKDEQWKANLMFLDEAIARGDRIVLSNSANSAKPGTSFYKELQYLGTKGYKPSADGMSLIKR